MGSVKNKEQTILVDLAIPHNCIYINVAKELNFICIPFKWPHYWGP